MNIDLENYRLELSLIEEIIQLYKKAIDESTMSPLNDSSNIVSMLRNENNILKNSIDTLNSKIKITETSVNILIES